MEVSCPEGMGKENLRFSRRKFIAMLIGGTVTACYRPKPATVELISTLTPEPETTPTPEIKFLQDFEKKLAQGEIPQEKEIGLYTDHLFRAYCKTMNCQGFGSKASFRYPPEEMTHTWQEEGVEPIVYYRTGVTNEIARLAPERVLGPDQAVSLEFPAAPPYFFRVSRIKGFAIYGTIEEEKSELLTSFNEMVILWGSNEFAQYCGLSPMVMNKDKEQLELTQEAFFRLGMTFESVWPFYRESRPFEFALVVGKKMGGMAEKKRFYWGFGLLNALNKNDKEAVEWFLESSIHPKA